VVLGELTKELVVEARAARSQTAGPSDTSGGGEEETATDAEWAMIQWSLAPVGVSFCGEVSLSLSLSLSRLLSLSISISLSISLSFSPLSLSSLSLTHTHTFSLSLSQVASRCLLKVLRASADSIHLFLKDPRNLAAGAARAALWIKHPSGSGEGRVVRRCLMDYSFAVLHRVEEGV